MNLATVPKRVLVVEDDPDIREVLIQILLDAGYEVTGTANGSEALQSLRDSPKFGLIILDLMMPVMNGWQFVDAYRQEAGDRVPIVAITAAGPGAIRSARALGRIASVLPKPIDLDELRMVVDMHLDPGNPGSGAN